MSLIKLSTGQQLIFVKICNIHYFIFIATSQTILSYTTRLTKSDGLLPSENRDILVQRDIIIYLGLTTVSCVIAECYLLCVITGGFLPSPSG